MVERYEFGFTREHLYNKLKSVTVDPLTGEQRIKKITKWIKKKKETEVKKKKRERKA